MPNRFNRITWREKRDYMKIISEIVKKWPLQNVSTIAVVLWDDPRLQKYYELDVITEAQIETLLKRMYGTKPNKGGTHGYIKKYVTARYDEDKEVYISEEQFNEGLHENSDIVSDPMMSLEAFVDWYSEPPCQVAWFCPYK